MALHWSMKSEGEGTLGGYVLLKHNHGVFRRPNLNLSRDTMQIHNYGRSGNSDLQLRNREPGPLGGVGNLQFKPKHGSMAGASRPGRWPQVEHFISELLFAVSLETREARDSRRNARKICENNRHIGNLLDSLMTPFTDMQGSTKMARSLAAVSKLSGGDLASLRGGQEFLSVYLQELTRLDLYILREDMLNNERKRTKVLDEISSELRVQASSVLEQIRQAVDRESVREPLWRLAVLLSEESADMEEVYDTLLLLPNKASRLDDYLQSLPAGKSSRLLHALRPEKIDVLERAVSVRSGNDPVPSWARSRLDSLRQSCSREMAAQARAEPSAEPLVYTRDLGRQAR